MRPQMERDCRRRIELDLEMADVEADVKRARDRLWKLTSEHADTSNRITAAFRESGKPEACVAIQAAGRTWSVSHSDYSGLRIVEIIPADSPLFHSPADAATAIDPDDDETEPASDSKRPFILDANGDVKWEFRAVVRQILGIPPRDDDDDDDEDDDDADSLLDEYGDVKPDLAAEALKLLADLDDPDPVLSLARGAALEDELGPNGRAVLRRLARLGDDDPIVRAFVLPASNPEATGPVAGKLFGL